MEIVTIETPTLGDRSYIVIADGTAVVIDPQRDIDRVLHVTRAHDASITHVLETHMHNDYLTGGLVLANEVGATYVVNADDEVGFERHGVGDGDVLTTGPITIRVMATPGHTFTHLSYVVEVDGHEPAVFTGGSLLYGSVGRPDLLGDEHTERLATAQWQSARRLVEELPGSTRLMPTHGFGSFCSATQAEGDSSTLAAEATFNPALTSDRDTFVSETLAGLGDYPAYYVHMGPGNQHGPDEADLSPPREADAEELRRRIEAGEWVVDLRTGTAYAPDHVRGTVNVGLDGSLVTYVGWLKPWETPVTLLGATREDVAEAQLELVRIGIDRPAAAAVGDPRDWSDNGDMGSYPVADFDQLASSDDESMVVLDVRLDDEYADSAVPDSLHIPLHHLIERMEEVPVDAPVWVYCGTGYRSSIAASLLANAGRQVVLIDDEFDHALEIGVARSGETATT